MVQEIYYMIKQLPRFIKSAWKFRKSLSEFNSFDSNSIILLLRDSLLSLKKGINVPSNFDVDLPIKIKKIDRCIEIIDNILNDKYLELSEQLLETKLPSFKFDFVERNDEETYVLVTDMNEEDEKIWNDIIAMSIKIEKEEWEELWGIIKGTEFNDGTGIKSWRY